MSSDVFAEQALARPLRQRDIDGFLDLEVPAHALARTWFRDVEPIGRERVVFDGQGRFGFERHAQWPPRVRSSLDDLVNVFTVMVFDEAGDPADIDLMHHVRKTGGSEITVEDGRGAVALLSAVRSARALNRMGKDEAERAGDLVAREHFRASNGKNNLAPPPDKSD